jgi:hypothetical protein
LHQVLADEALAAQALFDRRLAGRLGEEGSEGAAKEGNLVKNGSSRSDLRTTTRPVASTPCT